MLSRRALLAGISVTAAAAALQPHDPLALAWRRLTYTEADFHRYIFASNTVYDMIVETIEQQPIDAGVASVLSQGSPAA